MKVYMCLAAYWPSVYTYTRHGDPVDRCAWGRADAGLRSGGMCVGVEGWT